MNLYLRQPTPRRIVMVEDERRPPSPKAAVLQATACFGLFDMFSGNSHTATTNIDNRVGADNGAIVQQGTAAQATGQGVVVRDTGKILSPGALDNTGGTLTFSSDPEVIKSALQSVEDITQSVTTAAQSGQQN